MTGKKIGYKFKAKIVFWLWSCYLLSFEFQENQQWCSLTMGEGPRPPIFGSYYCKSKVWAHLIFETKKAKNDFGTLGPFNIEGMTTPLINIVNASKILALQYVSQNTFYTLFHRNANKTENLDPYHFIRNFFGQCLMCKGSIFGRWEIQLSKYYEVEIPVLISELEYSNLSKTV